MGLRSAYLSFANFMISRISMFFKGGEKESSDIGFPASIKKFSKPAGFAACNHYIKSRGFMAREGGNSPK